MKWLITGGCGFVGSNLADVLLGAGAQVSVLDNLSRLGSDHNLAWLQERHGTAWRFLRGDVRDANAVAALVREERPEMVAHLAGQVAATTSLEDPRLDFDINAGGTLNVLEACRKGSPESIVLYSSTNKVYGSLEKVRYEERETRYVTPDHPEGFDESLPLDGSTPYGCSKLAAESYVRDYFRVFGLRGVVFRHSSMYGGRQFATFDQGWLGWFCGQGLEMAGGRREPVRISGDGKQVRDLLHSTDLVRCYLQAAQRIGECQGEAINIGGGMENSLSLIELFGELERMLSVEFRFERGPWRVADQKVFVAQVSKARERMGWQPRTSYREGLAGMLEWTREIKLAEAR